MVDNVSKDGSDELAQKLMADIPNTRFIQMGENAGFGRSCNRAAREAAGKYLFLLNPDVWLESDCLEQLVACAERNQSSAVGPLVLNYDDDSFQSNGNIGFDLFGMFISSPQHTAAGEIFCANGFFLSAPIFSWRGGEDGAFSLQRN
jgi:GT2 family glycosyltransferase